METVGKKQKGENENISFCGLGSDDDWILNPMNLDDLKIREKLAMDLWNGFIVTGGVKMSEGRYIELVINGEYKGLYLLQRRLDQKYLNLSDREFLLKGAEHGEMLIGESLDIVESPYSEEETIRRLDGVLRDNYIPLIEENSLIDTTLFIQLGNMFDNLGRKNIYWIIDDAEKDNRVKMLLWDTDMSFGIAYTNKFVYALDYSINKISERGEWTRRSQADPSLNNMAAQRWFELRKTAFDRDNILSMANSYTDIITQSGALQRDISRWGLYYEGQDTAENFVTYIDERLAVLDEYYSAFLQ